MGASVRQRPGVRLHPLEIPFKRRMGCKYRGDRMQAQRFCKHPISDRRGRSSEKRLPSVQFVPVRKPARYQQVILGDDMFYR
jgi:hypothetical protein